MEENKYDSELLSTLVTKMAQQVVEAILTKEVPEEKIVEAFISLDDHNKLARPFLEKVKEALQEEEAYELVQLIQEIIDNKFIKQINLDDIS